VRTGTVWQAPVAARRTPGRAAALRYVAEDARSGYADAADRLVRALRDDGVGVEYRGWSNTYRGEDPAFVPYSRDDRPNDRVSHGDAPTVAHLVPEYYPLVRDVLDVRGDRGPLVAHTVWETDRIPDGWAALLNAVDRVIVPSEWNRAVFAAGGVRTPIAVVPHIVCDPVTPSHEAVAALGVPDDVVAFYTIGRWDERKAVFHTVRAFLEAFTADDPVVLVVKTGIHTEMPPAAGWGAGNPLVWTTGWQVAQIVRRYRRPAQVRVEVATWTDDQVAALHTRGDCFVGLARGEGWGMGAFDACAYGNPVIATGWGGYLEYLTPDAAFLVDHDVVHVEHHATAYAPDQRWAEPSIEHAIAQLRTVAGDLDGARRRAAPLRERVRTEFAANEVARRFLHAVQ
jgi:glycosyltransferase involved in cell wall biosynthesis